MHPGKLTIRRLAVMIKLTLICKRAERCGFGKRGMSTMMKAVNLHLLTRIRDHSTMSMLFQALGGRSDAKMISPHEAASLCALTDLLTEGLRVRGVDPSEWISLLDGFFFSYVIEHIGKEFDLLKISSDGNCILNIELKSEDIGEERIKRQLEQNRYYLSHAAGTICSFTYVMETNALYTLNSKGYMRACAAGELIDVLVRPVWKDHLKDQIDRLFRSADYLISPVAAPEKFLQGQYFLTNQQFDFRRRILEHLKQESHPVVSVTGIAGTGKTLLLFDLAMQLSRKDRVLLIHSGPLRRGHLVINERLKNVGIRGSDSIPDGEDLTGYAYLIADEADHLGHVVLERLFAQTRVRDIPVILAYDPHDLLDQQFPEEPETDTVSLIRNTCTLALAFTGNIRINRPVYAFLRTLLNLKDRSGHPDYSCVDVLYAAERAELRLITQYYRRRGYELIGPSAVREREDTVIAQEYGKVMMVMDRNYYYDDAGHLCARENEETCIRLLYEGLSRTRENLCLIIAGEPELFSRILGIRLHRP